MSELLVDLFISVDGCAYGARSPGYFGLEGPDLMRWMAEEEARPRRHLMGRVTYEMMADLPEEFRDESWQRMTERPTLVFSRTLTSAAWPGAELSSDDAVDTVRRLKQADGPDLLTVGSLSLVHQLLAAGLVDHLRLMVFPLVLGETGQQRALADIGDMRLDLQSQTVLDGGTVLLDYRPGGPPPYVD